MGMNLSDFAVDPTLCDDGKKIEFGGGAYIRVRSASAEKARKVRDRLWKPYASWKDVPEDITAKVNARWLAQGVLTEFVGFDVDGTPLAVDLSKPDDQTKLADILVQPRFKALRNKLLGLAIDDANFSAESDQAAAGN